MFIVKLTNHYGNHRCLVEKNVLIAFILPSKTHSHYCVFRMRLRQTVALLRRDRKIPISALTQSTVESAAASVNEPVDGGMVLRVLG